ncbi:hypothetical protein [Desulfuribacillus alkaliarsenatis]|uniref:Uncharacterized protein n=1 Tax=Desulfuribacillus alkaliarsenatis TaxID=766136 RepID=A0A1E5G2I6_9FIRM|nr:hypothetical protein [Desulfuribacillus alkaliarsenatis]OEF97154.1 hypothetical protein BHF68_06040 [Desulfuribacillus alkaliarsenatis]
MSSISNHLVSSTQQNYPTIARKERYEKNKAENQDNFQDVLNQKRQSAKAEQTNSIDSAKYKINSDEALKIEEAASNQSTLSKIIFPPESAPEEVKEAFDNLSDLEKRMLISRARILFLIESGAYRSILETGRPKSELFAIETFNNYFNQEDFSYIELVDKMIDLVEFSKPYNTYEVYKNSMTLLEKFKHGILQAHNAREAQ